MEFAHSYRQYEHTPRFRHESLQLFSHSLLDNALDILETAFPDWEEITDSFTADKRHKNNVDNMTGALAEHTARQSLKQCMCSLMDDSLSDGNVHTDPMPKKTACSGRYMFVKDVHSGNCVVLNPYTNQTHTEYDGVFALETPKKNGRMDRLIVVLESKLSIPRLPRKKGVKHVKRYVERKLRPLRALFNSARFAFVMTVCRSRKITRNQIRFMRALRRLGGRVAMLGVERSELKALALSYV